MNRGIGGKMPKNWKFWGEKELNDLKILCLSSASWQELREKYESEEIFKERSWSSVEHQARLHPEWIAHFRNEKTKPSEKPLEPESPVLEERRLPEPEILEVDKEAYQRLGARVGYLSGVGYKGEGYRAGLIRRGFEECAKEGTHFNVFNGGLVDKKYIKEEIGRRFQGVHRKFREAVIDHFLTEAARELASVIPKIKKPGNGFVRLYLTTSLPYDGYYGEEIARRLQELRQDDIRHHKEGGCRLEIKQPRGAKKKYVWVINPVKSRLPTKYYSQAAEREINDKRGQTTQSLPDLWAVGPFASNIHKPDGERDEPYITMGALRRLEEVLLAENQVSVSIVEYTPSGDEGDEGDRFVKVWNLKDLIANEREFITGIKSGAKEIHRQIIDVINKSRSMTVGLIADEIEIDRALIEEEIGFLVEDKKSPRKTWPGLSYNPSSQRYDYHLDWLQENLIYPSIPRDKLSEDVMLFFGCLHAGYTTTDYEYVVKKFPEHILKHKVQILVSLGDLIAGLFHGYLQTGEVFGNLNNTDQEKFAAELIGTVLIKVFRQRFKEGLASLNGRELSQTDVERLIDEALVCFPYIPGNHDIWQEREGSTPLETFRDKLTGLLFRHIGEILAKSQLPAVDIFSIINRKIVNLPDYEGIFTLPSGLCLGMFHPHMARADTTSLRAQRTIDNSPCQVAGSANYHTATVVNKWYPDRGQCVSVQTGTLVIYTRFEKRKLKKIDFGPVYLRVLSQNNRIMMNESAYFNQPILKEPIPKWTNLDQLKKELEILSAP